MVCREKNQGGREKHGDPLFLKQVFFRHHLEYIRRAFLHRQTLLVLTPFSSSKPYVFPFFVFQACVFNLYPATHIRFRTTSFTWPCCRRGRGVGWGDVLIGACSIVYTTLVV